MELILEEYGKYIVAVIIGLAVLGILFWLTFPFLSSLTDLLTQRLFNTM